MHFDAPPGASALEGFEKAIPLGSIGMPSAGQIPFHVLKWIDDRGWGIWEEGTSFIVTIKPGRVTVSFV
jgi:hypothetical protein